MTKRIFRSIILAAVGVFLASAVLFLWVLYDYFSAVQVDQLRAETELAAHAVSREGMGYFDGLDTRRFRVTWVGENGEVLFDSDADAGEMENHLEREEIREALESGAGESSRYSATLTERAFYRAQRLLDGTVLRLSVSQNSILTLIMGMLEPMIVIVIVALALSLFLASRLSRQIVKPLNALNLDEPLKNEGFDELAPLFHRIDTQQREIALQSEKLLQKQKELEVITENMAEGMLLLTSRGVVLSINRAAREIFDADKSCLGRDVLSVNRGPELSELVRDALEGRHGERPIELKGRKYELLASPVLSEDKVSGAVVLVIDITERHEREALRREFSANVSHELKTPLHTIAGSAELLMNGLVKDTDRQEFYARIYNEAQRMTRLVEDIIRLSHLDEGAADMKREPCDLYTIAGETVKALTAEAEKAGVRVTLSGESAEITGIPQLLASIVYNLTDNAIKYNRSGGSVAVSVKNEADRITLTVSDTGIGIPPEYQPRVFERFYRVDKSRSKARGGTGLGLSIVKHAAQLHDATIDLSSSPSGTTVTVTFPKPEA